MDCHMRNPSRRSFITDGGDGSIAADDMAVRKRETEREREREKGKRVLRVGFWILNYQRMSV